MCADILLITVGASFIKGSQQINPEVETHSARCRNACQQLDLQLRPDSYSQSGQDSRFAYLVLQKDDSSES